jgi:hypothetical protein
LTVSRRYDGAVIGLALLERIDAIALLKEVLRSILGRKQVVLSMTEVWFRMLGWIPWKNE